MHGKYPSLFLSVWLDKISEDVTSCQHFFVNKNFQYLALVVFMKLKDWIIHESLQCICIEQMFLLHYRAHFQDLWNYLYNIFMNYIGNLMTFCRMKYTVPHIVIPVS